MRSLRLLLKAQIYAYKLKYMAVLKPLFKNLSPYCADVDIVDSSTSWLLSKWKCWSELINELVVKNVVSADGPSDPSWSLLSRTEG